MAKPLPKPADSLIADYEQRFGTDTPSNADRLGLSLTAWRDYRSGRRTLPDYIRISLKCQLMLTEEQVGQI